MPAPSPRRLNACRRRPPFAVPLRATSVMPRLRAASLSRPAAMRRRSLRNVCARQRRQTRRRRRSVRCAARCKRDAPCVTSIYGDAATRCRSYDSRLRPPARLRFRRPNTRRIPNGDVAKHQNNVTGSVAVSNKMSSIARYEETPTAKVGNGTYGTEMASRTVRSPTSGRPPVQQNNGNECSPRPITVLQRYATSEGKQRSHQQQHLPYRRRCLSSSARSSPSPGITKQIADAETRYVKSYSMLK